MHQRSQSKDSWGNMFGSFLKNVSLKNKTIVNPKKNNFKSDDPLINYVPYDTPSKNDYYKREFYKYLDGQTDEIRFLTALNFPKQVQEKNFFNDENIKRTGVISKLYKFREYVKNKLTSEKADKLFMVSGFKNTLPLRNRRVGFIADDYSKSITQTITKNQLDEKQETPSEEEARKQEEKRKWHIQQKMKVLKDLVTNKIIIRKQDNKRQREEDVKNINFIRKFYNISMDTQERIKSEESYFDKKNQTSKKLRNIWLSYENINAAQKRPETQQMSKNGLKNCLLQNSKEYLQELERTKLLHQNDTIRSVRLNIEKIQNNKRRNTTAVLQRDYEIFEKAARQDKNPKNKNGILTLHDLKLYDYIHNNQIPDTDMQQLMKLYQQLSMKECSENFRTMIESQFDIEESKRVQKLTKRRNQIKEQMQKGYVENNFKNIEKKRLKSQVPIEEGSERYSDDESLRSIFEIRIDNLYEQCDDLKKKLKSNAKKDTGFAKRLKQIMKLQQYSRYYIKSILNIIRDCIVSTKEKLEQ